MKCNLINDDCTKAMWNIEQESVHLVITSPPYFVSKEYENGWTVGYFKNLMNDVFELVHRLLVPGGYFVVNFGDCFNSGNRLYEAQVPSVFPASVWYYEWGREYQFDLQATRIWRKQFAKMSIPFVCNDHPRNVFDYEHIWTFRKYGGGPEVVYDRKLSQRGVIGEDWTTPADLNIHCAAFPVELPLWAIDVYSKEGDTVLDPFLGSGTTGIAALMRKRNFIGIEKDPTYFEFAQKRLDTSPNQIDFD